MDEEDDKGFLEWPPGVVDEGCEERELEGACEGL